MIFASIFRKNTSPNNSNSSTSNTNNGRREDYGSSTVNDHNNTRYDVEEDGNGLLLKTNNNNETTPLMEPPTTRRGVSEASTVITGSGFSRGLGSSYTTTNTGSNSDRSSNNKNDENKHSSSLRHGSTFLMGDSFSSDVFAGVTQGSNQRLSTTSTTHEKSDNKNGDNDEAHPSFDEESKTKQSEEEEEATNLSSSWSRRLFKRSTSSSTQGSLMKSIYDHLPLKGSFAEMDKTDYTPNLLKSTSELLKPWEYIITPDHFGTWKRHVAWAKKDGEQLREHTAQRFSSNTVFMTLLLNSELATLFNSATITTEMRQDLYEGNVTSMKFYIGMVIIMSTFITIYAIISTFTVWGMVTVLSDENALCVLRSSIGQYATQLPSRLVATALCLFLCWVSMFLFILLPIEVALTITIGSIVLYLHIVHVYSNFGRLIIHSGAMGNQPIFSSKEEEHMRPEEFHNLLSERAGSSAARKMSVVHQYKNVSELLSKRLSVFSVGAFANIVPETDDGIIDDDGDEQSVTVALKQRTTPPRAPGGGGGGGLFGGGGLRQRRAAIGGRGISSGGGYGGALSHLGTSQSSGLGLTTHSSASSSRNHPSILSNQLRQTSNANSSSSGSGPAGIPTTSLNRGASSSSALSGRVSFKNGEQNQHGPLFAAGANNNSPTHDVKPFTSWRTNNSHRRGTSWGSSYLGGIVEAGSGSERSSPIRASPAGGTGQIQNNISNNNNPIAGDRLSQYHWLPSTNPTPVKETSFDTGGGKHIKETPEEYRQTSPPSKQPQQQQQQQQIRQRQNPSFDTKTIIDNKAEGLLDRGDVNVPPLDTTNNDTTTHQHNFKKKERVTSVHIGRQSIVSVLGMDESIGNDSNKVFTVVQNFSGGLEKQPSIDEDDLSFSVKDDIDTSRTNKRHSNSNIVIHLTDEAEEVSIGSPTAQRDMKEVSCYYEEERMDDAANELTTPMETSFESIMDHSSIASPTGGVLRQISERTFEGGSTISNVTNK